MSFRDFAAQTMFLGGQGDWIVYREMQRAMGEEPVVDSYLTLRRDARTVDQMHTLKLMNAMVEAYVELM